MATKKKGGGSTRCLRLLKDARDEIQRLKRQVADEQMYARVAAEKREVLDSISPRVRAVAQKIAKQTDDNFHARAILTPLEVFLPNDPLTSEVREFVRKSETEDVPGDWISQVVAYQKRAAQALRPVLTIDEQRAIAQSY